MAGGRELAGLVPASLRRSGRGRGEARGRAVGPKVRSSLPGPRCFGRRQAAPGVPAGSFLGAPRGGTWGRDTLFLPPRLWGGAGAGGSGWPCRQCSALYHPCTTAGGCVGPALTSLPPHGTPRPPGLPRWCHHCGSSRYLWAFESKLVAVTLAGAGAGPEPRPPPPLPSPPPPPLPPLPWARPLVRKEASPWGSPDCGHFRGCPRAGQVGV